MNKIAVVTFLLAATASLAVGPPAQINYQGVLRQPSGIPVDATHDMVFRFFASETGGSALLVDTHTGANAVTISDGLFDVALGSGALSGSYPALDALFRAQPTVWMQIEVAGEVLSPRVEVLSSAYSLMSADSLRLGGLTDASFLRSNNDDTAVGRITFTAASHGDAVDDGPLSVVATDSNTNTLFGISNFGVERLRIDGGGSLEVTSNDTAVRGDGVNVGGYFRDINGTGEAYVGLDDTGILSYGAHYAAIFENSVSGSKAQLGLYTTGIETFGQTRGGFFSNNTGSGYAVVGDYDRGIRSYGNTSGGEFYDLDDSGYSRVGFGDYGIWGGGSYTGAYFEDTDHSGHAFLGFQDQGVRGYGDAAGGLFVDNDSTGYVWLGIGDRGVQAYGSDGHYFREIGTDSYAWLAADQIGVTGEGESQGGYFRDINQGTYVRTSYSTSSVFGNGSKNFVQNHPYDRERTIVYTALEGDEAATYTRGTARLVDGEATIELGETFKWVTNPDIGLTAHLTPRGATAGLYVESLSTTTMVVKSGDRSNAAFDYVVFGLRVGFESASVVREKDLEAYIPSMDEDQAMFSRDPGLRGYTALERFKRMESDAHGRDAIDLSAGVALAAAVTHFDPATHTTRGLAIAENEVHEPADVARTSATEDVGHEHVSPTERPRIAEVSSLPVAPEQTPTRIAVAVPVEAGDVLVIDREQSGKLRPGLTIGDAGVFGVALEDSIDGRVEVAVNGIVELKADAGFGAIRPGDLLTTAPTAGHAMRATEVLPGTILGKALDSLDTGTGTVRVAVMLR